MLPIRYFCLNLFYTYVAIATAALVGFLCRSMKLFPLLAKSRFYAIYIPKFVIYVNFIFLYYFMFWLSWLRYCWFYAFKLSSYDEYSTVTGDLSSVTVHNPLRSSERFNLFEILCSIFLWFWRSDDEFHAQITDLLWC